MKLTSDNPVTLCPLNRLTLIMTLADDLLVVTKDIYKKKMQLLQAYALDLDLYRIYMPMISVMFHVGVPLIDGGLI